MVTRVEPKTLGTIINRQKTWTVEHSPTDRTTRLPMWMYVVEEGKGGALVNIPDRNHEQISLLPHAHDQLLTKLDYGLRLYDRLPPSINIKAINYLIQHHFEKDVLLRLQDTNQARAVLGKDFEPFDVLEFLTMIEPFCEGTELKWDFQDDLTFHLSLVWPKTAQPMRVGDIVQCGMHISNSEVGLRSVTLAAFVHRLKCTNGLVGYEGGGIRRFRHMGDGEKLRQQIKEAIQETSIESQKMIAQFRASMDRVINEPYNYLERIVKDKNNGMTVEQFKAAMDAYLLEPDPTLYGITNAITRAAQGYEGDTRYEMQQLGAKVLAQGLRN